MIIRRETPADTAAIHQVHTDAFTGRPYASGIEAALVDALRDSPQWIPALSLVAQHQDRVIGHLVATRGHIGQHPALGLGPVGVHPDHQKNGVGSALMHAVVAAADALDEPAVILLGDPGFYGRFGFVRSDALGITPPQPQWATHFQVRTLSAYRPDMTGLFAYAPAFDELT